MPDGLVAHYSRAGRLQFPLPRNGSTAALIDEVDAAAFGNSSGAGGQPCNQTGPAIAIAAMTLQQGGSRTGNGSAHARSLAFGKQVHAGVIGVVHVVHEHLFRAARNLRMRWAANVVAALHGRVRNVVIVGAGAAIIAPNVE